MPPTFKSLSPALILAVLASSQLALPADAAPLDAEGLQDQIIGRVLKRKRGPITMRVQHRADGTSIMRSTFRNDEGRWKIRGNQICVRWNNHNDGRSTCLALEPTADGRYKTSGRGLILEVED